MSAQAAPVTILLAEDDPDDVRLISRLLKSNLAVPVNLQVVVDGEEAVKYLNRQAPYDDRLAHPWPTIVFLDVKLPKKDGLEVLRWIRGNPKTQGLIVVMLTGSETPEDLRAAYDLHVNSFLRKSPLLGMPDVSANVLGYWLKVNQVPSPRGD